VDIDSNATATGTARISTFVNGNAAATTVAATDQPDTRPSSSSTIIGFDLRVGGTGPLNTLLTLNIGGPNTTGATAAVAALDTMMVSVNSSLATMGSQSKALDIQKSFLATLSDTVERGVSSLVDADLAKESARLQSLQIKQQLGAQALSIANTAPQVLLSLFRS
jgi:flagellin